MRINRVDYKNLKGRTGYEILGAATLIWGPNFAGKTTILDAIKLALLGYHPAHDKTGRGVMELGSADEVSVAVTPEDGRTVGRKWTRQDGRVTRKDFLPLDWPDTPVAVLDAGAYFGLTDRGKVDYLFRVAHVERPGALADVQHSLRTILKEKRWADELFRRTGGNGANLQTWMELALSTAESMRSQADHLAKRYRATAQGTAALGSDATPPPEDLPDQIQAAGAALERIRRDLADARVAEKEANLTATKDEEAAAELEDEMAGARRDKAAKEIEIDRATRRWAELFTHKDCPLCGTAGEVWQKSAQGMRDKELAGLRSQLQAIEEEAARKRTAADNLRARAERQRRRVDARHRKKIEDLELAAAEQEEVAAGLSRQRAAWNQIQADRRRQADAAAAAERAEQEAEAFKGAKAYLVKAKAKLLESVFVPLVEATRRFTDGVMRRPLSIEGGELGYRTAEGQWVPYRAFSGTEQAIAFAAFQAALGARAPIRLVIMDELGRLDSGNRRRLLENVVHALQDGAIEQFVGVDTEPPEDASLFTLVEVK
jgi:DNA repair exonuclease SbcCD ATPase subunit